MDAGSARRHRFLARQVRCRGSRASHAAAARSAARSQVVSHRLASCPLALSMIQFTRLRLAIDPGRQSMRDQRRTARADWSSIPSCGSSRSARSSRRSRRPARRLRCRTVRSAGFGPCPTCLPFQSTPAASMVFVIDPVARPDSQRRRMREREGVVKAFRREPMRHGRLRADGYAHHEDPSRRGDSPNLDTHWASRMRCMQE